MDVVHRVGRRSLTADEPDIRPGDRVNVRASPLPMAADCAQDAAIVDACRWAIQSSRDLLLRTTKGLPGHEEPRRVIDPLVVAYRQQARYAATETDAHIQALFADLDELDQMVNLLNDALDDERLP